MLCERKYDIAKKAMTDKRKIKYRYRFVK